MKRIVFLTLLLSSSLLLGINYDVAAAAGSAVGSIVGYYAGENLTPPILILCAKIGIINEDELFSPFSTLIYDAIDEGRIIGSILGAMVVKYGILQKKLLPGMMLDSIFSYSLLKIIQKTFGTNFYMTAGTNGLIMGVIW